MRLTAGPTFSLSHFPTCSPKQASLASSPATHERNQKGPGASLHSRPVPFQQRTNTSWLSIRSQPAVSRRLFRCLGAHLPRSPSVVKFARVVLATASAVSGHTTSVERIRSFSPASVLRRKTSFRCPFPLAHSVSPFVHGFVRRFNRALEKQKTLLTPR